MKLLWVIFMLQVFGNAENPQLIRDIIKLIFNYKCEVGLQIGEIFFWTISNPRKFNRLTHFQKFFKISKIRKSRMYIHYWVGSEASLDDKKEAAKYAIQHFLLLKMYYELTFVEVNLYIQRERETLESDLFKYIIISTKRINSYLVYQHYEKTGILIVYPDLYIVRGVGDTTRMKRVPVNTLWLKNDTCLVLKTGYSVDGWPSVYIHCGEMTNMQIHNHAKRIAHVVCSNYGLDFVEHLQTVHISDVTCLDNHSQLKSFIELLEDKNYYRPNEVDYSNEHLLDAQTFINEHDARISLSKIYNVSEAIDDGRSYVVLNSGLLKTEITERPFSLNAVEHGNYILNTDSISGVLVQIGSSVEAGVLTMQHAEEYVHNIESNTSRPTCLHLDRVAFPNVSLSILRV